VNFAKDLLTDGVNALLVPPENPSLLAISIERAMTDESLRENLKKGVDDLLQQISWDSAAYKTLKVYQRVLSRPEAKINCDLEN
jgi:glycosyltransferase involved in cell wall biosynthesis